MIGACGSTGFMLDTFEHETPANPPFDACRPHCRTPNACIAKTADKHCPPCNLSALHRDPAFRAKRAEAFRRRMADDPEFRAKHSAASAKRLATWRATDEGATFTNANSHANLKLANSPENTAKRVEAIRGAAFAGIPRHRWDECRALATKMPAADAKRIIMDDEAAIERRRLAALSPFERQMAKVQAGARLVDKPVLRRADHSFTLGGVATGMDL